MSAQDPLHTRICELLGIEFPVISAGMGFVVRSVAEARAALGSELQGR